MPIPQVDGRREAPCQVRCLTTCSVRGIQQRSQGWVQHIRLMLKRSAAVAAVAAVALLLAVCIRSCLVADSREGEKYWTDNVPQWTGESSE